jgi:hypothetical protein
MSSLGKCWIVVPLLASALVLAGCSSPTAAPTGSPAASASSAKPTTAPVDATVPTVRVPMACDDDLSDVEISKLIGSTVKLHEDASTPPANVDDIVERQLGVLHCAWRGDSPPDAGTVDGLTLSIEPDGATDFAKSIPEFAQQGQANTTAITAGEPSYTGCSASGGYNCNGDMLTSGYWVSVSMIDSVPKAVPLATAKARLRQVLTELITGLAEAGKPVAAWKPASGSASTFCSAPGSTAAVQRAFASKGLQPDRSDDPPTSAADDESGFDFAVCSWFDQGSAPAGQVGEVDVSVVQGGAWAIPAMVAAPPTMWLVGKYRAVTIPGASGAVLGCGDDTCDAIVGLDGNAVGITFSHLNPARDLAGLALLVADIRAA